MEVAVGDLVALGAQQPRGRRPAAIPNAAVDSGKGEPTDRLASSARSKQQRAAEVAADAAAEVGDAGSSAERGMAGGRGADAKAATATAAQHDGGARDDEPTAAIEEESAEASDSRDAREGPAGRHKRRRSTLSGAEADLQAENEGEGDDAAPPTAERSLVRSPAAGSATSEADADAAAAVAAAAAAGGTRSWQLPPRRATKAPKRLTTPPPPRRSASGPEKRTAAKSAAAALAAAAAAEAASGTASPGSAASAAAPRASAWALEPPPPANSSNNTFEVVGSGFGVDTDGRNEWLHQNLPVRHWKLEQRQAANAQLAKRPWKLVLRHTAGLPDLQVLECTLVHPDSGATISRWRNRGWRHYLDKVTHQGYRVVFSVDKYAEQLGVAEIASQRVTFFIRLEVIIVFKPRADARPVTERLSFYRCHMSAAEYFKRMPGERASRKLGPPANVPSRASTPPGRASPAKRKKARAAPARPEHSKSQPQQPLPPSQQQTSALKKPRSVNILAAATTPPMCASPVRVNRPSPESHARLIALLTAATGLVSSGHEPTPAAVKDEPATVFATLRDDPCCCQCHPRTSAAETAGAAASAAAGSAGASAAPNAPASVTSTDVQPGTEHQQQQQQQLLQQRPSQQPPQQQHRVVGPGVSDSESPAGPVALMLPPAAMSLREGPVSAAYAFEQADAWLREARRLQQMMAE